MLVENISKIGATATTTTISKFKRRKQQQLWFTRGHILTIFKRRNASSLKSGIVNAEKNELLIVCHRDYDFKKSLYSYDFEK